MIMEATIPQGAIGAISGLYYKIGRLAKAYYFNGDWIASIRKASDVEDLISKMDTKFSLTNDRAPGKQYGKALDV
jgi:hypothetical protein